jgi:peroxiredoxin
LRGIQKNLDTFQRLGVRPIAISVDTSDLSRELCARRGYTFTFLFDSNAQVIKRYDLVHVGAGKNGQDIARPAEFLLDSSGTVRWRNLTDDFRVRARPEQLINAARLLR